MKYEYWTPRRVVVIGVCILAVAASSPLPASGDDICGTALPMHTDGTYENACRNLWTNQPPDFGAFAERHSGNGEICAVVVVLSQGPEYYTCRSDYFVWEDDGGEPGTILAAEYNVETGGVGPWPQVSRLAIPLAEPVCVDGTWWVGYRSECGFNPWICADLDGPGGGRPMFKMPPGFGYPSGWLDVSSLVFGPTQALGISAEIRECLVTPAPERSWGRIKALYRSQ